jgi:hypothetical protein
MLKLSKTSYTSRAPGLFALAILLLGFGYEGGAYALPITKVLDVHVVRVCDDTGTTCASTGPASDPYFEKAGDKIWAQAGIDLNFIPAPNLLSDAFFNIDDRVSGKAFDDLSNPSATTVTMWLVDSITVDNGAPDGANIYGEGWLGFGGLVIDIDMITSQNRMDTIAHEIGHNLGLWPTSPAFGFNGINGHDNNNPNYLMAAGDLPRNAANNLSQICSDSNPFTGSSDNTGCRDYLLPGNPGGATAAAVLGHVGLARASGLLHDAPAAVPEPSSLVLLLAGGLAATARRRA